MTAKIGRPTNTGGKLANPFEGVTEGLPLPVPNDAASRGYLAMRQLPSGPLTTIRLRSFFGETNMEVTEWHLKVLKERGVLTYESVARGQYASWHVVLLDNSAAADFITELSEADRTSDAKLLLDYFWTKSDSAIYWCGKQPQPTGQDYRRAASLLGEWGGIERAETGVRRYFRMDSAAKHRQFGEFVHFYKLRSAVLPFIEEEERGDREWKAQVAAFEARRRTCLYEGPVLAAREALLAAITAEASHGADDDAAADPDLLRVEFERILIDRCNRAEFDLKDSIGESLRRLAGRWRIEVPTTDDATLAVWHLENVLKEMARQRIGGTPLDDGRTVRPKSRHDRAYREQERLRLAYITAMYWARNTEDLRPFYEDATARRHYRLAAMLYRHIQEKTLPAASCHRDDDDGNDDDFLGPMATNQEVFTRLHEVDALASEVAAYGDKDRARALSQRGLKLTFKLDRLGGYELQMSCS